MKYLFRPGARFAGISPAAAFEALESIRLWAGRLTPEITLDAASSPESPLYRAFEWSDEKAAREHRLWQARQLIRSVLVVRGESEPAEPVFVHVTRLEGGNSYEPLELVVRDEEQLHATLDELQDRVRFARDSAAAVRRAADRAKRNFPLLEQIDERLRLAASDAETLSATAQ